MSDVTAVMYLKDVRDFLKPMEAQGNMEAHNLVRKLERVIEYLEGKS